jgi:tetratricopeptide (TPR) repeat protein
VSVIFVSFFHTQHSTFNIQHSTFNMSTADSKHSSKKSKKGKSKGKITIKGLLKTAQAALQAGHYETVLHACSEARNLHNLGTGGKSSIALMYNARVLSGAAQANLELWDDATDTYREATQLDDDNPLAYKGLRDMYKSMPVQLRRSLHAEYVQVLSRLAELSTAGDKKWTRYLLELAQLHIDSAQTDDAQHFLESILEVLPLTDDAKVQCDDVRVQTVEMLLPLLLQKRRAAFEVEYKRLCDKHIKKYHDSKEDVKTVVNDLKADGAPSTQEKQDTDAIDDIRRRVTVRVTIQLNEEDALQILHYSRILAHMRDMPHPIHMERVVRAAEFKMRGVKTQDGYDAATAEYHRLVHVMYDKHPYMEQACRQVVHLHEFIDWDSDIASDIDNHSHLFTRACIQFPNRWFGFPALGATLLYPNLDPSPSANRIRSKALRLLTVPVATNSQSLSLAAWCHVAYGAMLRNRFDDGIAFVQKGLDQLLATNLQCNPRFVDAADNKAHAARVHLTLTMGECFLGQGSRKAEHARGAFSPVIADMQDDTKAAGISLMSQRRALRGMAQCSILGTPHTIESLTQALGFTRRLSAIDVDGDFAPSFQAQLYMLAHEWGIGTEFVDIVGECTDDSALTAARSLLESCTKLNPHSYEHHVRLGRVFWLMGGQYISDKKFAYSSLMTAARLNPKCDEAFSLVGKFYQDVVKHIPTAQKCFIKTLVLNPGNELAGLARADHLLSTGAFDQAQAIYHAATEHDPQAMWAWLRKARVEKTQNKPFEAIVAMQNAIRCNLSDSLSWEELGEAYVAAGKFHAAIKAFLRSIDLTAPDSIASARCLYMVANVHLLLTECDAALECLHESLHILCKCNEQQYDQCAILCEPVLFAMAQAHYSLAESCAQASATQRAHEHLAVAHRILAHGDVSATTDHDINHDDDDDAKLYSLSWWSIDNIKGVPCWMKLLANVCLARAIVPSSWSATARHIVEEKRDTAIRCIAPNFSTQLALLHEALGAIAKCIEAEPECDAYWYDRGVIHMNIARQLEQCKCFGITEHLESQLSSTLASLSFSCSTSLKSARVAFAKAVQLAPNKGGSWLALGLACKDRMATHHCFSKAIEFGNDETAARAYCLLAQLYIASGQLSIAQEALKRAQASDPSLALFWITQGVFTLVLARMFPLSSIASKMQMQAYANFLRAAELAPIAPASHGIAELCLAAGPLTRAVYHAQRSVGARVFDARAHNLWGLVLEQVGRLDDAVIAFRTAVALSSLDTRFQGSGESGKAECAAFAANFARVLTLHGHRDADNKQGDHMMAFVNSRKAIDLFSNGAADVTAIKLPDSLNSTLDFQQALTQVWRTQGLVRAHLAAEDVDSALECAKDYALPWLRLACDYSPMHNEIIGNTQFLAMITGCFDVSLHAAASSQASLHDVWDIASPFLSSTIVGRVPQAYLSVLAYLLEIDTSSANISTMLKMMDERTHADHRDLLYVAHSCVAHARGDHSHAIWAMNKALRHNPANSCMRHDLAKLLLAGGKSDASHGPAPAVAIRCLHLGAMSLLSAAPTDALLLSGTAVFSSLLDTPDASAPATVAASDPGDHAFKTLVASVPQYVPSEGPTQYAERLSTIASAAHLLGAKSLRNNGPSHSSMLAKVVRMQPTNQNAWIQLAAALAFDASYAATVYGRGSDAAVAAGKTAMRSLRRCLAWYHGNENCREASSIRLLLAECLVYSSQDTVDALAAAWKQMNACQTSCEEYGWHAEFHCRAAALHAVSGNWSDCLASYGRACESKTSSNVDRILLLDHIAHSSAQNASIVHLAEACMLELIALTADSELVSHQSARLRAACELARRYFFTRKYKPCAQFGDIAASLVPSSSAAMFICGLLQRKLRKFERAEFLLASALDDHPDCSYVHSQPPQPPLVNLNLGMVHLKQGLHQEAESDLWYESEVSPSLAAVYFQLALVVRDRPIKELDSDNAKSRRNFRKRQEAENIAEVEKLLARALMLSPNSTAIQKEQEKLRADSSK